MKISRRSDIGGHKKTKTRKNEQTTTFSSFKTKENEGERKNEEKRKTTAQHAADDDVDHERAEAGTHDAPPSHQHHRKAEER